MILMNNNRQYEEAERSPAGSIGRFVARIVLFVSSIVSTLLAFRFLLSLLGANPGNMIANFIYNASAPLVRPFEGIFNYQPHYGISRFDFETLVALFVYAVITWIIVSFVRPAEDRLVD